MPRVSIIKWTEQMQEEKEEEQEEGCHNRFSLWCVNSPRTFQYLGWYWILRSLLVWTEFPNTSFKAFVGCCFLIPTYEYMPYKNFKFTMKVQYNFTLQYVFLKREQNKWTRDNGLGQAVWIFYSFGYVYIYRA